MSKPGTVFVPPTMRKLDVTCTTVSWRWFFVLSSRSVDRVMFGRNIYLIWQSEHVVQREGCGNITLSGFNFPVFILFVRVSVSVSASSLVSNVIIFSFWTILGFYCFLRWHLSFSNCNNVAFCRDFVFGEWKCCSWRVAMLSRID